MTGGGQLLRAEVRTGGRTATLHRGIRLPLQTAAVVAAPVRLLTAHQEREQHAAPHTFRPFHATGVSTPAPPGG